MVRRGAERILKYKDCTVDVVSCGGRNVVRRGAERILKYKDCTVDVVS